MTTESLWRLQKAVYDALRADTQLTALVSPDAVYDYVPASAPYPCIAFGDMRLKPFDTQQHQGFEADLTLDCYSRYAGNKELQRISLAVHDVLHHRPLTVEDHTVVLVTSVGADFTLESDGETRRLRLGFKIIFETNLN
jgi:hypothetical protein